jgi:acetyl esterase
VSSAYARMMRGAAALASGLGRLPPLRPERHGLEITRDVVYREGGDRFQRLDVYRPRDPGSPLPALLYLHGGGFQFFDKASHWSLAARFARAGAVVFNANYRLAPAHPYPAAAEDAAAAFLWVVRHAARFGADPTSSWWRGNRRERTSRWPCPWRPAGLVPSPGRRPSSQRASCRASSCRRAASST